MTLDPPICVLHVDDDPDFTEMVAQFLEREDDRMVVHTATSVTEGLDRLAGTEFDCVVSDYEMPSRTGIEFLDAVREDRPDLPFVLFTGKGSEEIASDAISAGVTDYLQKEGGPSQYALLAHRIANAVERYRSRREVEASQERLSLFFDRSPLGAIEWSEDLEISRVNDTAVEILGYDEGELVGSSWTRLVPAAGNGDVEPMFSDLLSREGGYDGRHETVTGDGERIVCEWHNRVVRDERGDVVTIFSKFQDVTERVERQRQLAKERAFTEQALDTLEELFYVLDAEGNLTRWNERLAEVTGYSDAELAGRDALEFFPEDERPRVADAIETTLADGRTTLEADLRTADGTTILHEFTGRRLTGPDGEFLGLVGAARDLTERRERERELAVVRDLLERTERIADVGGWEIDTETMDVFWTDHLFDILEVDYREEPPLEEALDVYHEEDRAVVESAVEEALATGEPFDVEVRFVTPAGEVRWLRVQGLPTVEDGEVETLRGAVQDITDRKRHERTLERQNARLDEFASVVSHDLRNPLNVAEGHLELAREECESDHLDSIVRAHERMGALVDDLLELAREGDGIDETEPVAVGGLVRRCWETVATAGATLETPIDARIRADRSRLRQLLENLLRNAVEHGGEAVTVTVGALPDGFYVEDDGVGISPADRERVFEAGYSAAEDGTGFGLSIVEQVAEAHGWDVSVAESEDGGARFEFRGVGRDSTSA